MGFLASIFTIGGIVLMLIGLVEVVRRVRWGNVLAGGGVSDVREVMRLQELNRRIRDDATEAAMSAKSCFEIFRILSTTRFRDMTEPTLFVIRDGTWRKAREKTLEAARKGYRDTERFLRISMDSAILLLREAFHFSIQSCLNCPLLRGKPGELKQCPITETLKTETQSQQTQQQQ